MSTLYNMHPLPKAFIGSVTVSIVGSLSKKGVPEYLQYFYFFFSRSSHLHVFCFPNNSKLLTVIVL